MYKCSCGNPVKLNGEVCATCTPRKIENGGTEISKLTSAIYNLRGQINRLQNDLAALEKRKDKLLGRAERLGYSTHTIPSMGRLPAQLPEYAMREIQNEFKRAQHEAWEKAVMGEPRRKLSEDLLLEYNWETKPHHGN